MPPKINFKKAVREKVERDREQVSISGLCLRGQCGKDRLKGLTEATGMGIGWELLFKLISVVVCY